jgi:demethylmenaquinone methyltransferase / 2-methoxy-6-polyprenyl-1,4-benzoquinol methylase
LPDTKAATNRACEILPTVLMANLYYQPGEQRAVKVKELFDRIASRYDRVNDLQSFGLHRLWKRRVVRLARPQPGQPALDVCCGTGDLALALARQGAEVVGLDFNERMLAIAASRNTELTTSGTSPGVTFIQGDAEHLPFPDRTFDCVTIAYGLRNLSDWKAGLREMNRVAKPGGRLLVLDFGKPQNFVWRNIYFAYLRIFVPCLGWVFCGSAGAYSYILESLKQFPAQQGVAKAMNELGLRNVRIVNLLGGVMSINYGEKTTAEGE